MNSTTNQTVRASLIKIDATRHSLEQAGISCAHLSRRLSLCAQRTILAELCQVHNVQPATFVH